MIKDFLGVLTKVKINGYAKKPGLEVSAFDPHDESSFHSGLFKLNVGGKRFLVKEVYSPVFPVNPHSQFVLHQKLQTLNHHLKRFNCEVASYLFAWEGKRTSFVVSDFIPGETLENWISKDSKREKSGVFNRFIKSRRILFDTFGIRDVTTRNVMFNPRTGKLTFFDLMPPN